MNKIKTAIASFGMSGKVFHAPLIHTHPSFELTGILERTKNESRLTYPDAKIYRSFEEVCGDDNIELVVVNTPDHLHFDMCKTALENRKHVVVEKPFTLAYAQAMDLTELAEKQNMKISVFQNRRWDGDFLTIQKILREGLLGRLVFYEAHFDRFRNFIQEGTWKEDAGVGTGTLYNLGSHLIDQALVLFGKPVSVTADIRAMREGSDIDDMFEIWMNYPDVKVTVTASYLVREPGPRYLLHGTQGSYLMGSIDPQEEALKKGEMPGGEDWGKYPPEDDGWINTQVNGKDLSGKIPTLQGNYLAYYDGVYDALRLGKPLVVNPADAALVIKVIEAAKRSVNEQKAIKL